MSGFADTGFIVLLYLEEATTKAAQSALAGQRGPLPVIPLTILEFRNTLNLAIVRGRISAADRDALWRQFEAQIRAGFFVEASIPAVELHAKARVERPLHADARDAEPRLAARRGGGPARREGVLQLR